MNLLIDISGFLGVILEGFARAAQCVILGSVAFIFLLAVPLRPALGAVGDAILARARRIGFIAALILLASLAAGLAIHVVILAGTLEISLGAAVGDDFSRATLVRIAAAALVLALIGRGPEPSRFLPALVLLDLVAGVATSHAAAQIEHRAALAAVTAAHHLAAGLWIGGLPAFLAALGLIADDAQRRRVGKRYSAIALAAVAGIALSGTGLVVAFVGSPAAAYGTAYGQMLGAKVTLFAGLLLLGGMNFLAVEHLSRRPAYLAVRLRRFVEVELGIGLSMIFIAASMTSLPPAIDLVEGRASLAEIAERLHPHWPRLTSPGKDSLAFYELQQKLDAEAQAKARPAAEAYVPGSGIPLPRNAEDIAWSEYNHHIAGVIVLAIGLLALLERSGWMPWARHWPLLFVVLAWFLFVRSEAEGWPFGRLSLAESLRDPEFVQHKVFMALIVGFAGFEWSVRIGWLTRAWARYVFPLLCAIGGMMLLTHSHSLANVKELLLIEMTHIPLAVFGIWAGWTRWLELRMEGRVATICGWAWPILFSLVGLLLLTYREI